MTNRSERTHASAVARLKYIGMVTIGDRIMLSIRRTQPEKLKPAIASSYCIPCNNLCPICYYFSQISRIRVRNTLTRYLLYSRASEITRIFSGRHCPTGWAIIIISGAKRLISTKALGICYIEVTTRMEVIWLFLTHPDISSKGWRSLRSIPRFAAL